MREARIPQPGSAGFQLGAAAQPAAAPAALATAEAKSASRMGSLVSAVPAEARTPSSLGDAYEQTSQNQSKIEIWKSAYSAFFPEGSA
jgi:hypothetical protein